MTQRPPFLQLPQRGVGEGATPFPGLLHLTLDLYLVMLSVKQGDLKYHFFESLVWLDLGLNPALPGYWQTLYSIGQWPNQVLIWSDDWFYSISSFVGLFYAEVKLIDLFWFIFWNYFNLQFVNCFNVQLFFSLFIYLYFFLFILQVSV